MTAGIVTAPLHDDGPPPAAKSYAESGGTEPFQASIIDVLADLAHQGKRIADVLDAEAKALDAMRRPEPEVAHDDSVVRCESCNRFTARATAKADAEDGVYLCPECEP